MFKLKKLAGALAGLFLFSCGLDPALANQSNTWSPTTGTVSGLQLTNNYNNAFSAIQSCNSGAGAPTNDQTGSPVQGQCWLNTGTTPFTVQMYDGAVSSPTWTTVGWLDSTNHQWIANNGGAIATVSSGSTTDLCNGTNFSPNVTISGTTTISSFGSSCLVGQVKYVNFTGSLTLTHNASNLILPNGGANITTAAGDTLIAQNLGSGAWRIINYTVSASNVSSLVLLNTLTASTSATLADTTSFTSTYRNYLVVYDGVLAQTNAAGIQLRLRVNSGGVQTTSYTSNIQFTGLTGTAGLNNGTVQTTFIPLDPGSLSSTGVGTSGSFTLYNPSQTSAPKQVIGSVAAGGQDGTNRGGVYQGWWTAGNGAVTGIQIDTSNGNILTGTFKIYGMR